MRLFLKVKYLEEIYGPKYEDGEWKSGTNRELEALSKGENIVKWIKGQRISWLDHLKRMEEERMPRKIFTQELEGTRRRKRWREEVERVLQVLGVRRWRELVIDRENGEVFFDRPKPQRAVAPTEEEEEEEAACALNAGQLKLQTKVQIFLC
jgi:hypothetical protein